jgi:hypothetical protein
METVAKKPEKEKKELGKHERKERVEEKLPTNIGNLGDF